MRKKYLNLSLPPTLHDKPIGLEEGPTGKASMHLNCRLSLDNMTQSWIINHITSLQPIHTRSTVMSPSYTSFNLPCGHFQSYPSWWHKHTHNEHSLGIKSSVMWCYVTGWTIPNIQDSSAGLLDPKDKRTALFYMNAISQQHSATNHRTWIISSTAVRT